MNKPVVVQPDDEMDSSKVEIDDSMDGVEEKPMSSITTDSEDHLMSDVSGMILQTMAICKTRLVQIKITLSFGDSLQKIWCLLVIVCKKFGKTGSDQFLLGSSFAYFTCFFF